jgi:hypothetical protein
VITILIRAECPNVDEDAPGYCQAVRQVSGIDNCFDFDIENRETTVLIFYINNLE